MRRAYTLPIVAFSFVAVVMSGAGTARAEAFVDLYIGAALTAELEGTLDADPAGSIPELFGDFDIDLENSVSGGARAGYWLDSIPWLGFGLDGSHFSAEHYTAAADPEIFYLRVIPVSGLLMLRFPLIKSSAFPRGQVHLYSGVGPAAFISTARAELKDLCEPNEPCQLTENFDDTGVDVGVDARVGIKLFHVVQSLGIFAEYRFTHFKPSEFEDDIGGVPVELEYDRVMTHHVIFGMGFHF